MNEQLLKDLVATAQQDNYNWDVVLDKFPELSEYDPQLLKDYIATVEKEDYNYEVANSKFPEFKFEEIEKTLPSKNEAELNQEGLFETRDMFTTGDFALEQEKEEEARKAKYNIDEAPGKYYIDGKEVDREILKNKLFDNDFINDLQDEKIKLDIPEGDDKLKSLAKKQKESGSRLGDLWESLQAGAIAIENFKNAGLNYVEDVILETTGYKPGNVQLAYRAYRDLMSKSNIEKRNKLKESQREYKDGFVNSIKNGNFADAANLGFRTTAESLPLMILSSLPAVATRGKSIPTTQLLIKQALGSSGMISGILIPDEYEESRFSDDPKLKELTRGDKLGRAFLRGGAEGFFEGIMGPVGAKSFQVFKSGIRSQVRKTFNIAGKEAAQKISKELGDKTAKEIIKAFGINTGLEGVTEALTSLGQDLTDDFYGVQDLTLEDYMSNAFEAFALGSFMGGTVQSLGATGKVLLRRNSVKQGAVSKIRKEQELGNISKKEGDLLIQKIEELQSAVNQTDSDLSEEQQEEIATLIYEKNKLKEKTKDLDPNQNSVKQADERVKEIDNKISEISASEADISIAEKTVDVAEGLQEFELDRTIRFLETQGKKLGKRTYVVEDEFDDNGNLIKSAGEKAQEIYDEYVKENPGTEQMDVSGGDGFKIGNIAVINKTLARQTGAISVGSHETFHFLVDDYFEGIDIEDRRTLIKDFKNLLSKEQLDAVNKRIQDAYMGMKGFDPETSIEWFTAFSDAIELNQITFNESIGNKILNFVQEILRKLGIKKEFSNARQAYNFMKDYSKSVSKGQVSKRALKLSETPSVSKKLGFSKTKDEVVDLKNVKNQNILNGLVGETDAEGFYKMKKQDFANSEAKKTVDILLNNKAFDRLIGAKIKVTDFAKRQEILERSREEVEKHINRFNPQESRNLFGYINSYIQNKVGTAAKTVLKAPKTISTDKKIGGEESRATVGETLVSDEISPEEYADIKLAQDKIKKIKPQQSKIAKKIDLTDNEINLVKRDITNFLRKTDRPAMTDPKKFFKAFVDYVSTATGNRLYDKLSAPKDGLLSTKNRESFIKKIAEDLNALNKVDPAVMRRSNWKGLFYDVEIENMNPTQTQKAIDEGRIPSTTNLNAGNDLFKTLNPSTDEVVDYLMKIRPDVFKRKMPKFLAEVIAKNEFNDIVNNKKQPIYDAKGNKTDRTIDLSESVTEEEFTRGAPQVREKIARPEGIKFSASSINNAGRNFLRIKGIKEFKFNFENKEFTYNVNKGPLKNNDNTAVKYYQYVTQEILPKYLPISNLVNSNNYASRSDKFGRGHFMTGKQRASIVNKGLKNEKKFTDKERKIVKETVSQKAFTTTKKGKKQLVDFGSKEYLQKTNNNYNGLEYILFQLQEMVKDYPETSLYVAGLFNSASGNSGHFIRQSAIPRGVDQGFIDAGFKGEKEHIWQQNQAAETMFDDILNGTVKKNFSFIKDNYFMLGISNTNNNKLKDLSGKYGEKYNYGNLPPSIFIDSLVKALENNDFSKAMSIWIRYFNSNVNGNNGGMNPNFLTFDGKTVAELFNVGVEAKYRNNSDVIAFQNSLIEDQIANGLDPRAAKELLNEYLKLVPQKTKARKSNVNNMSNNVVGFSKTSSNKEIIGYAKTVDEALKIARDPNAPVKKIRVFDFDDTLATTKSNVLFSAPNGTEGSLTAEKFAMDGARLLEEGYVFDFSEFNKVTKGKPGPLLDIAKKIQAARGTEDVFVLTARNPEAQVAIKEFLDSVGLNIPLENITGLGNSTGEAKANWMVEKAAEGYNDFYFADDALQNVEAVRKSMDMLDVKSKAQLVRKNEIKFSKTSSKKLNFKTDDAGNIKANFTINNKKYNLNLDSRDNKGSFDVEFDLGGRIDITGTGDAVKVVRTVYNGLLEAIDQNKKIKKIEFSSLKSEPSRVRLYTTLMNSIAKKLGWNTDVWESNNFISPEKSSYDFEITKPRKKQVAPVEKVLNVVDVKSEVQQDKIKFSKSVNEDFNKIIEQTTGIASEKIYSEAKAKVRGANKGNKKFFIPYSAEDFMGLIYPLLSKGKLGDSQMAWFKKNLLDPYAMANENIAADRIQLMEDFKALKKALEVPKDLRKKTDSGFTKEQAVRVYLFDKAGYDVPGISKTDLKELLDLVNSDGVLKAFGDQIFSITKGDGYAKPGENWLVGTITTDLIDVLNTVKRAKYLEQSGFTANAELIFSKDNLNKLEAAYGTKYREAMENILGRMKSGKNRIFSGNRLSNRVLDYINNSTGAIMFFNTRSAVLQTISAINFLNWSFNNPIKAGAAFANQPQYWKDFVELINSDYLVDRRNGLKLNINESEIADAAATSKNKAKAAINYILQKGFLPTQFADSFAIAAGGATFYRNRIKDLIKNEGMSEADAKKRAMLEWRETAEVSQQSSDPSKISAQQASDLGRVILAFANTPMQYARIQKRALQDIVNGRGDTKTNVSKIIYYAVVQNLIFNALQSALFGLGFGDDEDDEKKEKMYTRIANGMLDSQLRGLGLAGATVSVIKNFLTDIYERSGRKRPEYVDSIYKLLQISPPVSSKISKIRGAAWQFDSKKRREEIFEKGFSIDNPAYEAGAKVISATVNVPLDRVYSKVDNISGAMDEDAETWQTVAMLAGWPKWQIMPRDKKQEQSKFKNGNVEIITFKTSVEDTKKEIKKTKPKRKKVKLKFK